MCGFIDAHYKYERAVRDIRRKRDKFYSMLCALETNASITKRFDAVHRKTSLRQILIAVRRECVLDTRYPYHEKLHGGTDLVHSELCEGITFIASQSIFVVVRFDGQCQVMDSNALAPRATNTATT